MRRWRTSAAVSASILLLLAVSGGSAGAVTPIPSTTRTVTMGGPFHGGITPREAGEFAGTKSGDAAVYYHYDLTTTGQKSTWLWDGRTRTWRQISVASQPSTDLTQPGDGDGAATGTMPQWAGGQTFLYSGARDHFHPSTPPIGHLAEMFVFGDDERWTAAPCTPHCAPGKLDGAMSATNGTDTLLFGGQSFDSADQGAFLNRLWRWNGTDWDELSPTGPLPPGRAAGALTFDGNDFILFGGGLYVDVIVNGVPVPMLSQLGDTWRLAKDTAGEWHWQEVCQVCAPPARFQAAFAGLYGSGSTVRGALLVGGFMSADHPSANELTDQWWWDGGAWNILDAGPGTCEEYQPSDPPPPLPTCYSDPAYLFTPFSASMPGIGAAAWTAGICHEAHLVPTPAILEQTCDRETVQYDLVLAPAPSAPTATPSVATPASSPTPAAAAVTATPRFAG